MTTRNAHWMVLPARKGLNTNAPSTLLEPDELVIADNVEYDTSGVRKKRGGTTKYNSSQVTQGGSAVTFTALADYWRHSTCPDPAQKFVAHAGTTLYKDDGDGTWDVIDSGLTWGTNASRTNITIAQGLAIFSNGIDPPKSWDQTTLQNLSADAPYFLGCVYHLRRLWVFGYAAALSTTWYTAASDVTNFTGADTGTITFDEDDGDRLIGVSQPWQNRLYFFKGPNGGSVWNISGNTPRTFVRTRMFSAAPCVAHRSIVTTPDDIYWVSRHGIHSLKATNKFGDTEQFYLSHPIQDIFRRLNPNGLDQVVGFYHPTRNIVGWLCPEAGVNSVALIFNYVLANWSVWRFSFDPASAMLAITPGTRKTRLYVGGYDGHVRAADQDTKSDDGSSAYTFKVRSPVYHQFGDQVLPMHEKSAFRLTTFYKPVSSTSSFTVRYWLDSDPVEADSKTVTQTLAGSVLGSFVLNTDVLDSRITSAYDEFVLSGRFRSIQLEWEQSAANQDFDLYGHALTVGVGESMAYVTP